MFTVRITRVSDGWEKFVGHHEWRAESIILPSPFVLDLKEDPQTTFKLEVSPNQGSLIFSGKDLDEHDVQLMNNVLCPPGVLTLGIFLAILKRHGIELKPKPNFKVKPLEWLQYYNSWKSKMIKIGYDEFQFTILEKGDPAPWIVYQLPGQEFPSVEKAKEAAQQAFDSFVHSLIEPL